MPEPVPAEPEGERRPVSPAPAPPGPRTDGESTRPPTLALLAEWCAERYADLPALRHRTGYAPGSTGGAAGPAAGAESASASASRADPGAGEGPGWASVSFAGVAAAVRDLARGLIGTYGIGHGDRVAILSETRPEWTYAQLAVFACGAVVVPVYPTAGDDETRWVLADSAATLVLCENEEQVAKIERLRADGSLPALRDTVPLGRARTLPRTCPPEVLRSRAGAVRPEDRSSLVYTSGTTGPPKGCVLTHGNLTALHDSTARFVENGPGSLTYLYLPLAHLLAQLVVYQSLMAGAELCYFGGRVENIVAELGEVHPTHLPSVPRLFEKVHGMVTAAAESTGGAAGSERYEAAVRTGLQVAALRARGGEPRGELLARYEAADSALLSLVRTALGGRLRWALTGAAPIARPALDLLVACGVEVYEGYGMTESGGVIALNHPGAVRLGTVGRPIPGCEVRIAEDDEVLARGAMVFPGYHANPAATASALDAEGWLHTGDLGALDEDGYLTITGRKKDLIITSGGKNLSPSEVELAIQRSRFVSHAVLVGDHRPYPVALLTLDPEAVAGLTPSEARGHAAEAVAAANAAVARPARVRDFAVLDTDFSIEDGTLTPTLKLRRAAILERHADTVEALYQRPE